MLRKSILFLLIFLSSCGFLRTTQRHEDTSNWTVNKFYSEAKHDLEAGDYKGAIRLFEGLEARYPYGIYPQQALLEIAYANYKERQPAATIIAVDRFIKLYPNHPNVDYAYYLKGLANFNDDLQVGGAFIQKVMKQKMAERDSNESRESFENFKDLVTRFPNSKYRADGIKRMTYLINEIAMGEIYVAHHYIERGAYIAAVNRAQFILKEYPQTQATEEALSIIIKSYDALGMNDLRDDAQRVMRKSFPDSPFLSDSNILDIKSWWKF